MIIGSGEPSPRAGEVAGRARRRRAAGSWRPVGRAREVLSGRPLLRRITGYSAGSVIAAGTSELAFILTYGWGGAGTTWASAAGFVGGAIPNYVLNRAWAWNDRRGRSRRSEFTLYVVVALASFVASAFATRWVADAARRLTGDRAWQVTLAAAAFLAVSGAFFVAKFVVYELVVFTRDPGEPRGPGRPGGAATRS